MISCAWPANATCLLRALQQDGALSITNIPGLDAAQAQAMQTLASCAEQPAARSTRMHDGTARFTVGGRTLNGAAEPLLSGCAPLEEEGAALRSLVDKASR